MYESAKSFHYFDPFKKVRKVLLFSPNGKLLGGRGFASIIILQNPSTDVVYLGFPPPGISLYYTCPLLREWHDTSNLHLFHPGKRLLGGMLVGDTSDYGKLLMMSKSDTDLDCEPDELLHGRAAPTVRPPPLPFTALRIRLQAE